MINIRKLQDINLDDIILKQNYYDEFISGNIDVAHTIIEDNPELKTKVLSQENLNNLINGILTLELQSNNDINIKLENLLNIFNLKVDELIFLNDYKQDYQYNINNFVIYNNEIYFCYKKPPIGTNPTKNSYWIYLGLRGNPSPNKLGIMYQGFWSSSKGYNKYDMVIYNNNMFIAKRNNINKIPLTNKEDWFLGMKVTNQNIYVSKEEPKG